jgi:tetratricopeptide (TPR) repeat protein
LGQLFEDRGQYEKALQLYKESLQAHRDLGDQYGQAVCLNNIGNAYQSQGNNDDALTYFQQALQLREQLNVPGDMAVTLHNLGEVYAKTAQYDKAMTSYMRAMDLRRKTSDARGAALESHSIGVVFAYQGRYGAAMNSLLEAVKGFHDFKDRSRIMAQVLIDYGDALAQGGRGAEADKTLGEARELAGELKNDNLVAGVLNAQGDVAFFGGDFASAGNYYRQGLQTASRVKGQDRMLVSKLNLAKIAVTQKQGQALGALRQISEQANAAGLNYLAIDSSVSMAEAMIINKNYSAARQELEQQLGKSEKLGLRMQTAKTHYLLGNALRLSGNAGEAAGHYQQTLAMLDEMKKESGAERLLDRSDLKTIYAEATRWSQAGKG